MNEKIITICVLGLLLSTVYTVCGISQEREMNLITISPSNMGTEEINNNNFESCLYNEEPFNPTITGPLNCKIGIEYSFFISAIDPQNDNIHFEIRFSDSPSIYITKECSSRETFVVNHIFDTFYQKSGPFHIMAKAIDTEGHESDWTTFQVEIPELQAKYNIPLILQSFKQSIYDFFKVLENIKNF